MKKLMMIVGVASLAAAAPAQAKWWDAAFWSGEQGCPNNVKNRWYYLIGC